MQFRVTRRRETRGNQVLFIAVCTLTVGTHEMQRFIQFGAAPLTEPPPRSTTSTEPGPKALITADQLQKLISLDGLTFDSADLRQTRLFVTELTARCQELPEYWKEAATFDGYDPDLSIALI